MPPVASTTALAWNSTEAAALAVVAERAGDAVAVLEQPRRPCTPCARRCPGGCRDPAACGSSPGRCGRRRGPGADSGGRRSCAAGCGRPCVRSNTAPQASSSRTRSGASLACSSAMRQLLTYWPPRMVSAKWTFQLSRSSTLASAAAMPPSAMTVCALPSSDLQTRPTDTPAADASMAARSPAPPAPMTRTSCSCVWYSGHLRQILQSCPDRPSSTGGRRGRQKPTAEQAAPRPQHVPAVEAARRSRRPCWRTGALRQLVETAADQVAERVAAEGVAAEQRRRSTRSTSVPTPMPNVTCPVAGSVNHSAFHTS